MEKIKLAVNKISTNARKWVKTNPKEFYVLLGILVVATILRFYKINEYMTFLGDEGRDVIIVRRLLTQGHPPLIGPGTSIGNMYLGPLYYYMMAPALLLANFSPVGPAVQIAILGVVTVFLVWFTTREWFGKIAATIAAILYAISPTVIIYSRSSWNPNIMPFFALLTIYSIWKVWKNTSLNWLIVLGFSFAAVVQSHYLGLLLAPTIFVFYAITFWRIRNTKLKSVFVKKSFIGLGLFLLLMSPLLIFDIRHNWMNAKAMYVFFTERQTTVSIKPWSAIPKIPLLFIQIVTSLVGASNLLVAKIVSIFLSLGFVWLTFKNRKKWKISNIPAQYYLLFLWMFFALIGFGVYKQNIYDHYFGFVFAVPAILIGAFVSLMIGSKKILSFVGILGVICLVILNLLQNPLRFSPNNQLKRSMDVSAKIISEDGGKPFDLAVLAERNYEDGYRYFLELSGATVMHADRWDQKTIVDQLFVVCEMEAKKCDPTHSAKAEVANFGMTKIDQQWEADGVIIYRLLHTK